jgi:aspartate/methionine/tyrosine aminotransferase
LDAEISQIMVTAGAIEGLAAAVMAVVDPGDEVILPSPTYSTHVRQGHLRMSFCVPEEEINKAFDKMEVYFE